MEICIGENSFLYIVRYGYVAGFAGDATAGIQ